MKLNLTLHRRILISFIPVIILMVVAGFLFLTQFERVNEAPILSANLRFGLLTLAILTSLFIGYWQARAVVRHLERVTEAAAAIANGQYDKRITVVGNDEISLLSLAFNKMAAMQNDLIENLQEHADKEAKAHAALLDENAALLEEKEQAEALLANITIPLTMANVTDNSIVYVNEPFVDLIRTPKEDLIGKPTDFHGADRANLKIFLSALSDEGFIKNQEALLKRGDGTSFWALISAKIVKYQGHPVVLTSFLDISDRKLAQAHMEKLANELTTVAQVSTVTSTLLQPQELLQEVADLTKERFGLYHAHILLLNEQKNKLTLTAGAGEVGRQMVAEGRHIPLAAQRSLIATVARNKSGAIRNYSDEGEGFMPHPLLAETRSEMAVPIMLGDEVLGVLDVRSEQHEYFSEADMQTQTTLAAQVAVALQNARSFARSEQAVTELRELSRRLMREGWDDYLAQQAASVAFRYDLQKVIPVEDGLLETAVSPKPAQILAQPLLVQNEPIGQLRLSEPKQYGDDASEIMTAVAEHLSTHLENLRLSEQSERDRAAAEKRNREIAIINNVVTQISASLDLQHSLQIIVDELVTAVQVDQVRIALLQPDKTELVVIAEHYDSEKSSSALGQTIPVLGNKLTEDILRTRQTIVVENAQTNPRTAPVHHIFQEQGIETLVLMPLVVNDEVIGTIGLDILDKRRIDLDSLRMAETIVYQAATAVQNARLFEQTQAALAETETLYAYSSQLNKATNLDAALQAAVAPGFQIGATGAFLLVYEQDAKEHPEYGQIAATTPQVEFSVGARLPLSDHPLSRLWPAANSNIFFVGDVKRDDRLRAKDKTALKQSNVRALALMFLSVGNLQLGQIVIRWDKPQTFTEADERLYGSIAQQASSVVYNRLLFNQTEEALSETAALYQASADINTAQTFDEIITALRRNTVLGKEASNVSINYFDEAWTSTQSPKWIEVLARWSQLPPEVVQSRYPLANFPSAHTLLYPDELTLISDIANDDRVGDNIRALYMDQFNAKSTLFAPLVVGGRWVGYVNCIYPQTMQFTENEIRRLKVLTRQAAVSIQSIRLYEQTQAALEESEALYIGSECIVLSSTENDILHALIQSTVMKHLDRANIFMFDEPVEDGVPRDVTAVAVWENEDVRRTVKTGTRFLVDEVPFMKQIQPDRPMIIRDIREDTRVDEQTGQILEGYGMRSFILFPLVTGNQWLGMVSGQSAKPLHVDEAQVRRSVSLVGQSAVVLQTMLLYRQEQERARREQLLREITAKVRSSADVDTIMRTAVIEIGRALGRPAIVSLDSQSASEV